MKKRPHKRHFPYKHPTFGTKKSPKPSSAWQSSVYYWWWQYLRRSENYQRCCESGGKGRLADLYANFGDVRSDDFKRWWMSDARGMRLFSEPRSLDDVRQLQPGDEVLDPNEALSVSLPLYLPRRYLMRKFRELLNANHSGRRGVQLARQSNARFKVKGQPNTKSLERGLLVYDRWKESNGPLWRIGNELPGILRTQKLNSRDTPEDVILKKRDLASTVSRYIKRVQKTIKNVEKGVFP